MSSETNALEVLRKTSRTFYISIVRLPQPLRDAVMSSYLALRAIDEIEDHTQLDKPTKIELLCAISNEFQRRASHPANQLSAVLGRYENDLAEVTNRLDEWIDLAPMAIASRICDVTATMAQCMAYWVGKNWQIRTKRDLDRYTFGVAGSVGLLLSELWAWHDGTQTDRRDAIGFGRGLQAVNILRNRPEDLARGVDFFPDGWRENEVVAYARTNLALADAYVAALGSGDVKDFCVTPLKLAYATLEAIGRGENKLSRTAVLELTQHSDTSLSPLNATQPARELSLDEVAQGPHPPFTTVVLNKAEHVILVNERDEAIGIEEKITTHLLGALHRAFSIFILNSRDELLLQKRTMSKYHSKGLWSNTCCGHPRLGESIAQASLRRLREEMGFDCKLRELFAFTYRAEFEDGLTEHEYDHVLIGSFNGTPTPNKYEVDDWKWVHLSSLQRDLKDNEDKYTCWFKIAFKMLISHMGALTS